MYKITLYDECYSPICDGTASFFTEDLEEFERYWQPHADEEQLKRYERSKAGEIVTDYYGDDSELNIVQEDESAEILFEKEFTYKDKQFTLLNAYHWGTDVYAAETYIVFRGIKFNGDYYLIGKYKMQGVCRRDYKDAYKTVSVWGNQVLVCNLQEKPSWYPTDDGWRGYYEYHKEDFKEDSLETYCWVSLGRFSEENLLSGSIDLESEETMICLMRDIPGEAG